MWYENSIIYQIYPLGLCGAPYVNDGIQAHRLGCIDNYISHIKGMGVTCIMFNPLFQSDAHGYDTRDYYTVDCRLGTNDDFKQLCQKIHLAGMKIMLDGVFNHVGRGFWAFEDVRQNKWDSRYKEWFHINFDGNSCYNDGFYYEGWEGHYELVKLNLRNAEVKNHIFDAIRFWIDEFDIDGLRLDVTYSLPADFLSELRGFVNSAKQDFVLVGETLHGDYNRWMNDSACHSVTNYECYKGIYSSFNCGNMHEISYSLNRQFGSENWCLYTGKHLLSFADNHDVTRLATILQDENHIPLVYTLLFGMPGVPCIYYGSEWGAEGDKSMGDHALRPYVEEPQSNSLTQHIQKLCAARNQSKALRHGTYRNVLVQPKQLIFERCCDGDRILVAINSDSSEYVAHFDAGCGTAKDLISGKTHDFGGGSVLPPYSSFVWKMEC